MAIEGSSDAVSVQELEQQASQLILLVQKCVEILRTAEEFNSLKPAALWSAVKKSQKDGVSPNEGKSTISSVDLFSLMNEKGLISQLERALEKSKPLLQDKLQTDTFNSRQKLSFEVLMPLASALSDCYALLDQIPTPKNIPMPKRGGKQPPPPPGMLSLQNYTDVGAFLEFCVCTSILPFLEPFILFAVEDRARYFLPKSLAGRISRPSLLWGCFAENKRDDQSKTQPRERLIELKTTVLFLGKLLLLDRFRPMLLPRHLADLYAAIFQAEAYSTQIQQFTKQRLETSVEGADNLEGFALAQEYDDVVSRLLPRIAPNDAGGPLPGLPVDPALQAQSLQTLLLQGTKAPMWLRQRVSKQLTELACQDLPVIIQVFVHAAPPKDKTAASVRLARTLVTSRQSPGGSTNHQKLLYGRLCEQIAQILDNTFQSAQDQAGSFTSKQTLDIHTVWALLDHMPAMEMQQRMLLLLSEGMLETSAKGGKTFAIHRSVNRIAVLLSSIPPSFNPDKVTHVFLRPLMEVADGQQSGTKPTILGQLIRLACLPAPVLKSNFNDHGLLALRLVLQAIGSSTNGTRDKGKRKLQAVEIAALIMVYSAAPSSWDLAGNVFSRVATSSTQGELTFEEIKVEHTQQPMDPEAIVSSVEGRVKVILDDMVLPLLNASSATCQEDEEDRQPESLVSTLFYLVLLIYFSPNDPQHSAQGTSRIPSLFRQSPGDRSGGMFRMIAMCFLPLLCEKCPMESLLQSSQQNGVGIFRMMHLVFSCTSAYFSEEKLLLDPTDEVDATSSSFSASDDCGSFVESGQFLSQLLYGTKAPTSDADVAAVGAQSMDINDLTLVVSVASLLLSLLIAIMELGTKKRRSTEEETIIASFIPLLRPLAVASDSSLSKRPGGQSNEALETLGVACAEIGEMAGHAMALIAAHKAPSSSRIEDGTTGKSLSKKERLQRTLQDARVDLSSTQPPIRARGVVSLQHFLRGDLFEMIANDKDEPPKTPLIVDLDETQDSATNPLIDQAIRGVLELAISALEDKESYVYLAAIQSIAAAADRCPAEVMPRVALALASGRLQVSAKGSDGTEASTDLSSGQRVKLAEALIFCIRRRARVNDFVPMLLDAMFFGGQSQHEGSNNNQSDVDRLMLIHRETQDYFLKGRESDEDEDLEEIEKKQKVRLNTGGPLFQEEEDDVVTAARVAVVSELVSTANPSTLARHCPLLAKTATSLLRLDASRPVRRTAAFLARELYCAIVREQNDLLDELASSRDDALVDIELSAALMSSNDDEVLETALRRCLSADDLGDTCKSSHRLFDSSTAARCQEAMDARQDCLDGGIFVVAAMVVESKKRDKLPASRLVRKLLSQSRADDARAIESLRSLEIDLDRLELKALK